MAAHAARQQARLAYEKVSAQAAADIAVARLAYEDAFHRWQTYRESIRPKSEEVRKHLTEQLGDRGLEIVPTAKRLAEFNAVENTYLSIFQILGGLGMTAWLGNVFPFGELAPQFPDLVAADSAAELWLAKHPEYHQHEQTFDVVLMSPARLPVHVINGL